MSDRRSAIRLAANTVMILAVVAATGYYVVHKNRLWAVTRLRSMGAEVSYGPKGGYFVEPPPGADVTEFLKHSVGALNSLSRNVQTKLDLDGMAVSDSDLLLLEPIADSSNLRVSLRNTSITDEGLRYLQRIPGTAVEGVSGSNITNEAWQAYCRDRGLEVRRMPQLNGQKTAWSRTRPSRHHRGLINDSLLAITNPRYRLVASSNIEPRWEQQSCDDFC